MTTQGANTAVYGGPIGPKGVTGVYDYGQYTYPRTWRKPVSKTTVTKTIERDADGNITKETTVTETTTEEQGWTYPDYPHSYPLVTYNTTTTTG